MLNSITLLSLPRSGSTLLQRILSVDPDIATVAEPWVLLPLVYALKPNCVYAEYSHERSRQALIDLLDELPKGRQDYLESLGEAIVALYSKIAGSEVRYFLDKTPRYALISDDVITMFPRGRFIFLWRNPLAIISSMIETQRKGKWNIYIYKVDLFDGLQMLVDTYQNNREAALSVNYEALLMEPERELTRIMDYLDMEFNANQLEEFSRVRFRGRMGDPTGTNIYDKINTSTLDKWKTTINNPLRKMWCKRYLRWIGHERLEIMGYDLDKLLFELNTTRTSWTKVPGDMLRFMYGLLYCLLDTRIIKQKLGNLTNWKGVKHYS